MEAPAQRHYPRPERWYQTVTGWIILVNIVMFFVQQWLDGDDKEFTFSWALSLPGLQEGHWWQLLTFQVLHGGPLHLVINCLLIHVMGRAMENYIGKRRLLEVYLASGVAGGLLEIMIKFLWPDEFPSAVLGASAGACGLIAVFATLFPWQPLRVLILFIIPVSMKARTLLWFSIIISLVGMTGVMHDGIAHAGHLGGILWGIIYTKLRLPHYILPPPPPPVPPPIPPPATPPPLP